MQLASLTYYITQHTVSFLKPANTQLEMDVDELPASILNLDIDSLSILSSYLTSFEVYLLTQCSAAMRTRLSRSVRELEVCTSPATNIFPSNYVSIFAALRHIAIGVDEPHAVYEVVGLHLSMLPSSLTSLEIRNAQVLSTLFGPESGWTPDPSASSPIVPSLPKLTRISIQAWGIGNLEGEDSLWLKRIISHPRVTLLFLPLCSGLEDSFGRSITQLEVSVGEDNVRSTLRGLPPSLAHLSLSFAMPYETFNETLTSQEAALLPATLTHLSLHNYDPQQRVTALLPFISSLPANLVFLEVSIYHHHSTDLDEFYSGLPRNLTSLRISEPGSSVITSDQWHRLPKSLTNFPLRIGDLYDKPNKTLADLHGELDGSITNLPTALGEARIAAPLPHHITSLPCINSITRLNVFFPSAGESKTGSFDPIKSFAALATLPALASLTVYFGEFVTEHIPLGLIMSQFTHPLSELSFQNVWFSPAHHDFDFTQVWAKGITSFRLDCCADYLEAERQMEMARAETVSNEFLSSLPHSLTYLSLTLACTTNLDYALESCPPYLTSLAIGITNDLIFHVTSHHLTHLQLIYNGSDLLKSITVPQILESVGPHMESVLLEEISLSYPDSWRLILELEAHYAKDADYEYEYWEHDFSEAPTTAPSYRVIDHRTDEEEDQAREIALQPIKDFIMEHCPNLRLLHHQTDDVRISIFK